MATLPQQHQPSGLTAAQYDAILNDHQMWRRVGDRLLFSAAKLQASAPLRDISEPGLSPREWALALEAWMVVAMLRAMALENFLKALWIKAGETLVRDAQVLKIDKVPDHRLVEMAGKVFPRHEIDLTPDRTELLRQLTTLMQMGRYPQAKKQLQPVEVASIQVCRWGPDLEHLLGALLTDIDRALGPPIRFVGQERDVSEDPPPATTA